MPAGLGARAAGRAVTLGIRPEHLELVGDGNGNGNGNGLAHLSAQVIEQLGADTVIHGHFGNDRADLTVRLQGTVRLAPGEMLALYVAPEHLHLFDPETGARLGGD